MAQPVFNPGQARRLAGYELSGLTFANVLPVELLQGSRVPSSATPIYDLNGDLLFYRYPVIKGRSRVAYADIAASPAFSEPLLAVSIEWEWDEQGFLEQAINAAKKIDPQLEFSDTRFVAYSYPKLAVQFLSNGREVLMLELVSWQPVPSLRKRALDEPPSNFERWSLLDEVPTERKEENLRLLRQRIRTWDETLRQAGEPIYKVASIDMASFELAVKPQLLIVTTTRELHYSLDQGDHYTCYEVRGQKTGVWCVAASVQMVLDFYRYNYTQERIAADLGLGSINNPMGLPYSWDYNVVIALENLTSHALNANMDISPNWNEFVDEVNQNRPLVSFIPGHSRTVAGFTDTSLFGWHLFRGLVVYDPWPPNLGVITRWENFNTQTYRRTFTAHLTLVERPPHVDDYS
jgi:hypothetical protein